MLRLSRLISAIAVICVLAGFKLHPGLFCRYNVRETGFVDLGVERYTLYCYVSEDTPSEAISSLRGVAEEVFLDTSVRLEIVDIDRNKDHPALTYLDLTEGVSLPTAFLVSPHEVPLAVTIKKSGEAFENSIRSAFRELIQSPLRENLVGQLVSNYAVVLLIESIDAEANEKARQAVQQAVEEIEQQMDYMPKPITRGPVLFVLKADALTGEKILLWSLGLAGEGPDEPRTAVLYGRGRWIGPVLSGQEIEEDILFNILSIVGLDCECGLDPRLIRGTILPIKWNKEAQVLVAKDLGFDPENPMVKLEVSQILRMRASLYPDAWMNPNRTVPTADDLPVPFVEDTPAEADLDRGSFISGNLLFVCGIVAVLVLLTGAVILLRASRNRAQT